MPPADPDNTSEKSNYSVDEIMDRLRHEGGSRRRRTVQQTVITKKKRRIGLLVTFLAFGLLLAGIVVFQMLNRARIEGELFRQAVGLQLGALTGADVDCDRFRSTSWTNVNCPNVRVKSATSVLKDGLGKNLQTFMSSTSFWRDEWDILTLTMDEAQLTFRPHIKPKDGETANAPAALAAKDGFRMGLSASPAVVTIHDLQCPNLTFTWPGAGEKTNRVQDLNAKGSYTDQALKFQASSGRWIGGIWPDVPVDNLAVSYRDGHAEIESLRLRLGEKNQLRASGGIDFTPAGPSGELDVKFDPMQITDLISPTWQRRLHGKFSPVNARYTIRPDALDEFSGDFAMDGLVVEKFPGLDALCKFFKSELYSKLEFRQVTAHFRRTNESFILENINAVRHGECKLTGKIEIKRDGTLTGTLRLALNTVESNLPQFAGEEDGLDLIDFTLSGTESDPIDSLGTQFPSPAEPAPESK